MKTILRYLKPQIGRMLWGLTIKITGTFADLGLPWVLAYILDDVIPTGRLELIFLWGGVMVLLAIMARAFNIIANRKAALVARDATEEIRYDLFEKINHLSGAQTDAFSIPSLISRLTSDSYNIHKMIGMAQRMGVRAPIILIGGIIITSTLEPVLTLALVAVIPFLIILVISISKKGIPLYSKVQDAIDKMVMVLRENIAGIRVVKALSKTEYEKDRFEDINGEVVKRELKAAGTMAASGPIMNLMLNLGLTLVVVIGAYRVNSGASEPGKIVAFLSYFTMILNAILMVNRIFLVMTKATASAERISKVLECGDDMPVHELGEMLEAENDAAEEKLARKDVLENEPEYHIEFKNVSFGYNKGRDKCLENITFALKCGEMLGIIGPTGCGKTTIINLLMRYYDADEGEILINGRDIKTIPFEELRGMFGVVFQNDTVFADTIRENIDFGRGLSQEKIEGAVEDACAASFITDYDFQVAIKGANLSGGQKQRLLISRALAGGSDILVFDDSSSALDYKTDASLRAAIRKNHRNSTIITVAQRISSIMSMEHIIVMEEGRMLGYGNHEELLESCPVYKEIFESQMGG